jgi:hypothetical protein
LDKVLRLGIGSSIRSTFQSSKEAKMKLQVKLALVTGALALGIAPAALADGPTYTPPEYTPAPPPQAKAYGYYCRGQSKKHVKGEKGTAFSRCVKAMAQAAHHEHMAPGRACKDESKKHVKGQEGTSFSRCVKGVAQMRKEHQEAAPSA